MFFFLFPLCYDYIYDWICFTHFKHLPDDFTMHLLFGCCFFLENCFNAST